MLPYNLLIFPLIGGYYFITTSPYYKYVQLRLSKERLLLNSVLAGIILFLVSLLFSITFNYLFPEFTSSIKSYYPVKQPFLGTAILSFLLGTVGGKCWQLISERNHGSKNVRSIQRAINLVGSELELLLNRSFSKKDLLLITLKCGKVYVGWANTLPVPDTKFITIIPVLSGYRKSETHQIDFTTKYNEVFASYMVDLKIKSIEELDIYIVINQDEITTVTPFDLSMYKRFNEITPLPTPPSA